MRQAIPFALSKEKSFFDSLGDWMGDMLYDELPEKGLECRDEQIFMAYQIEKVLREKSVLFAEAGVGTGKTIAYLLPAISYARYTGRPALIACADETLIDQLVKDGGDIHKLQQYLDLNIDVRLAKSRDQYLCLKRFEEAEKFHDGEYIDDIVETIPDGVFGQDHYLYMVNVVTIQMLAMLIGKKSTTTRFNSVRFVIFATAVGKRYIVQITVKQRI